MRKVINIAILFTTAATIIKGGTELLALTGNKKAIAKRLKQIEIENSNLPAKQ